ncbi:MAG: glycosyltransferase family 2 protein [Bdellovibrionales bacterium]
MTNVVVPLAANLFFDSTEYFYPKPLIEVRGVPIIQHVIEGLKTLPSPRKFIFILNRNDDARFHLQDTLRLVAGPQSEVVLLEGQSQGAVCSILMAVSHLRAYGSDPLVVANGDQVLHVELSQVVDDFKRRHLDAGVITFDSVHPRWSYVRLNSEGLIVEAAEKRPLSRHAVAGFYYFAEADQFTQMAMKSIEKGAAVNGQYYVAPVLNEYVLEDRRVGHYQIDNSRLRTFYSIQRIEEAQREGI